MKIIFLGAPGAGKGTQAEIISEKLGIPAISTGAILRQAVKDATKAGLEAKSFMDAGTLVPDEVMIAIIKDRTAKEDCQKGFILDGFPRTVPQAEALDEMGIAIDKVVELDVPFSILENRLTGRRVCQSCGAGYHVQSLPPKKEGVCDRCGGELMTRKDDKPEVIGERLEVYAKQTAPLKDYYEKTGKLKTVDGSAGNLSDITAMILKALEA